MSSIHANEQQLDESDIEEYNKLIDYARDISESLESYSRYTEFMIDEDEIESIYLDFCEQDQDEQL